MTDAPKCAIRAHIAALEAGRDAAYARGLEDAAKVADQHAAVQWSEGGHYQRDDYQRGKREHAGHAITHVAAAIRALKPRDNELKQGVADTPAKPE